MRRVFVTVTPSPIVAIIRQIRARLRRCHLPPAAMPDPHEYSTLDSPMEVPVQVAAYELAVRQYVRPGDRVLDVGFGLGYGMVRMAEKAEQLIGIEIDRRAVCRGKRLVKEIRQIIAVKHYDGRTIPYDDNSFDVVACVDVLEHVPDYMGFLQEMVRVSRRVVFVSTPNRRPEYTRRDGRPKNLWHLREWSYEELDLVLCSIEGVCVVWNVIDGPWEGPFVYGSVISQNTMALAPALVLSDSLGVSAGEAEE